MPVLVEAEKLAKHYPLRSGVFRRETGRVRAVDDLSFRIGEGETYSLVGESGCGKSTTGRLLLRLEPPTAGSVRIGGTKLDGLGRRQLRAFRKNMQIVFQDPFSSLNPRLTAGVAIEEGLLLHAPGLSRAGRRERVTEILETVGLTPEAIDRHPHEFSGGQRQRLCLARSLAVEPRFIVADEAVSALDVSIQAQIINLLRDLQEKLGLTYLFISHDLAVVRNLSNRVGVMYLGHLVEEAPAGELFREPLHPYTQALLSAIPEPDPSVARTRVLLSGDVPSAVRPPPGCRFHTRCRHASEKCRFAEIPERNPAPGRRVKCVLY